MLSGEGILQFDYSGYSHEMGINDEAFDVKPKDLNNTEKDVITKKLKRYNLESASDLELLTTAIYVYNHINDLSKDAIIAGVKKIKGNKYSREQIELTFKDFSFFGKNMHS